MIEKLMHKYALSKQGASDMIKAIISATISNIILMVPVALLYYLVRDYMAGNLGDKVLFYVAGCLITFVLIGISTYIQYNATFLSTYVESGVRRVTLAEKLRKIPLSFFGKKDLSDLTSTIMNDCAQMETASSHFIPELFGACISTALIAIGLFFFDWRMAIAALWVLPVSFLIVGCSGKVQKSLNKKIKKYLDEIAKTEKKIADLQQYLRGVQAALKQEEDNEMIRCIRGMKMDNDQLYDLLDGIQSGKVKFQVSRESDDEGSGSFVFTEENKEEYQNGEMEENE